MGEKYTCRFCGKEYTTLKDCVKCESVCLAKSEKESEEIKRKAHAAQKEVDAKSIKEMFKHLSDRIDKYTDEYDEFPALTEYSEPIKKSEFDCIGKLPYTRLFGSDLLDLVKELME